MERDNDGATPAHFAAARGQDITQYGSTVTQIEHSVAIAWYELIKLQATLFSNSPAADLCLFVTGNFIL